MSGVETATAALREAIELLSTPRIMTTPAQAMSLAALSQKKRTAAFEALRSEYDWPRGSAACLLLDQFVEDMVPPPLDAEGEQLLETILAGDALSTAVSRFHGVAELPSEYAGEALEMLMEPFTSLRQYRL